MTSPRLLRCLLAASAALVTVLAAACAPDASMASTAQPVDKDTATHRAAPVSDPTRKGTWTFRAVDSLTGGEGIATRADGSLVRRGLATIPLSVRLEGFKHIGDLDIANGLTFDSFQGPKDTSDKMFLVTEPGGKRVEFRHPLDPGEAHNNSFVTVSPDGKWMVSGEFGRQKRLLVFPAPSAAALKKGGTLEQAGQIALDTTVTDVQSCDFFSGQRLLCASNDKAKDVFAVDLPRVLDGRPVTGKVSNLFTVPQESTCKKGEYETEGDDYDATRKILRVAIVSPGACRLTTRIYSFTWHPREAATA